MYCSFFLQKMVTTPHKKRYVYPKTNHIMSISHMLAYPKLTFTPVSKTNSGNPYHRHPTRTKTRMPTCRALVVVVEVGLTSILEPGPAWRVDPGPGRPGPGTGPGEGKNPLGNWLGKTRSTRRVDPGPGPPGQTRVRPGQFFFLFWLSLNDVVFSFQNDKTLKTKERLKKSEAKSLNQ